MKPQEKWDRLNNPQCLKDYGISLTKSEMMSFPEGRVIIRVGLEKHCPFKILELTDSPEFKQLMTNAAESRDKVIIDLLRKEGDKPLPNPPEH